MERSEERQKEMALLETRKAAARLARELGPLGEASKKMESGNHEESVDRDGHHLQTESNKHEAERVCILQGQ